jgi:CheY-like chemotaxis protein
MLGLTSYQEALRALGYMLEPARHVRIVEQSDKACIAVTTQHGERELDVADLENIVLTSHARRGGIHHVVSSLSDVLRSVGLALDELHALDVCLDLAPDSLSVRFRDRNGRPHDLSYAGEELEALQRVAAARRNGQPLRRVLILQASVESATPVVELLVAEFAVQALPILYARAVARATQPPDLVLAQVDGEPRPTVEAIQMLRSGKRTASVPIVILAAEASGLDPGEAFAAGADDLLQEPVLPAQLRARLRTWLLRRR